MDSILNYPAYFQILDAFGSTNGSIPKLADVHDQLKLAVKDTSLLGGFTECHDQVRVPSFVDDATLVSNIIAYPFVSDGIPILYYGQEQGFSGGEDPANREPMWPSNYDTASDGYRFVQMLTAVRSAAGNASADFYTTQVGPFARNMPLQFASTDASLTTRASTVIYRRPDGAGPRHLQDPACLGLDEPRLVRRVWCRHHPLQRLAPALDGRRRRNDLYALDDGLRRWIDRHRCWR